MTVGVIVQARESSTRLPGKVLLPLGEKTVLEQVVERLQEAKSVDKVIIATTINDHQIITLCQDKKIDYYIGDEADVLSRYYEAATTYNLDVIVRVTSDCPLIDYHMIDVLVSVLKQGNYEYCTNSIPPSFARGLECSAFTYNALQRCQEKSTTMAEREHVITYIRQNLHEFRWWNYENVCDETKYRITLDEEADYKLLIRVYDALYKGIPIPMRDALRYIEQERLFELNAHIKQKS